MVSDGVDYIFDNTDMRNYSLEEIREGGGAEFITAHNLDMAERDISEEQNIRLGGRARFTERDIDNLAAEFGITFPDLE